MSHLTARGAYQSLVERLNRFPQGAPPSEVLYAILALLFTEREAGLVARLPIKPFTVAAAARAWQVPEAEAQGVLDALADRAILLDVERPDGSRHYVLPPPMAGFFEFSMMRLRGDLDQALLARLFHEYLNVEEDFIKALFLRRRDATRARVRERGGRAARTVAARARLRARQRDREAGELHRHRPVLLPAQDAARPRRVRRAARHLHDVQHRRLVARPATATARRVDGGRVPRPAPRGARAAGWCSSARTCASA